MQAVYGYKIYTDTQRHDNTIGLYEGTLCWIMAPVALVAEPWKRGIITPSSAMDSEDGLDTRTGGGRSEVGGFNIVANNTLQITAKLAALGIVLTGKRCERIRFDPTNGREYVEYTGFCEEITWNEREIVIPVQDCQLKRDANLSVQITSDQYLDADESILGNAIPVTYGVIDKAKFVRTANAESAHANPAEGETVIVGVAQLGYYIESTEHYPFGLDVFAVIEVCLPSPTRVYAIAIAGENATVHWTEGGVPVGNNTFYLDDWVGRYLKVTTGKSSGELRRIEEAYIVLLNPIYTYRIYVKVSDYFTEELAGNATGTADQNSWVQIVDIAREYEADTRECKAFTDQGGADIVAPTALQLYSYEQPKTVTVDTDQIGTEVQVANKQIAFYRLPEYAYTESASALKNAIAIDAKLFDGDPDKMNSFIILPPDSLTPIKDNTLSCFNEAGEFWHHFKPTTSTSHLVGGYYYDPGNTSGTVASCRGAVSNGGGIAEVIDKNRATYFYNKNHWPDTGVIDFGLFGDFAHAIRFTFAKLSGLFNWDDCFLLVDVGFEIMNRPYYTGSPNTNQMYIRYRKYVGNAVDCFDGTTKMRWFDPDKKRYIKDSPDFYFDSVIDNNKAFYWDNPGIITGPPQEQDDIYGHTKFLIPGIVNDSEFNAIRDFAIVMKRRFYTSIIEPTTEFDDELRIYELGIMFRKSVSIGDAIYSGMRGRIRGTTWRPGRIASDLLDNPIDILEDALRRQNWSETGSGTTPGEQSSAARINVKSTHGGFESSSLDTVRSLSAARQILTYDESRISEVVKSLCQQYHLVQYRESNGSECVVYFPERDTELPGRTITLADVPEDEEIPEVEEPSPADVFCYDLTIRYSENYGSGKFDGTISITHTDADEYDPDYVQGYDGGYKQAVWERAHALYQKFKRQEKPPTELTDLTWHRSAAGAGWYLRGWLNWMGKSRLTLPVKYEVARKIPRYSRVTINLPHHTDGQDVICFVERIKTNPTTGRAALGLVLYDDVSWSGGVYTSVSKSSSSDSLSQSVSVSVLGSKSKSSSSDSLSQSVSVSMSSPSDSSQPEITDDHRHIAIWTQQNDHEGVKMKVDKQVGIYASLIDFSANQINAFGSEDNQYAAIKKIVDEGGAEIRGFTTRNHNGAVGVQIIGYTENELDATYDAGVVLGVEKHDGAGGLTVVNDNSKVLVVKNHATNIMTLLGSGQMQLPEIWDAGGNTNKIAVFDAGYGLLFRTGAELLSDIGAAPAAHNLLSTTHGDTLADTVVRGDILIGNATPKWARLAFPATPTGKVLVATATDVAWSAAALGTAAWAATGNFAAASHNHAWSALTSGVPTTVGGYGITDFNSLGDARWSLTGHNHSGTYDPAGTGHTEAAAHVSAHESTYSHANYNTAYGWGNHASAGYLTSVTAHNLLSTTHGDTLADTVVRGDILIGNATPKWARLAKGTAGYLLRSDGTDTAWASLATAGIQPLDATLTALAGLAISASSLIVGTAADTFQVTAFAANKFPMRNSTDTYLAAHDMTDFALTVLDDADGAAVRTTIGAAASGAISGTQNYLAKFGATGATVGNSSVTDDGTLLATTDKVTISPSIATGVGLNVAPQVATAAGAQVYGVNVDATAMDPETGSGATIIGYRVTFGSCASVDNNASMMGFRAVHAPSDNSYGYISVLTELTADKMQCNVWLYGGSTALSATGVYRGLWFDYDSVTRDANAPVLQGLLVQLPDDYANFGTCYGAKFEGDARSVQICDTTYALNTVGAMRFGAGVITHTDTTDASDKDTAAVVLQGGIGIEKSGVVGANWTVTTKTTTGSIVGTRVSAGAGGTSGSPTQVSVAGKTIVELTPTAGIQYYELTGGTDCQIVFMRVLNTNDSIYFTNVYGVYAIGIGIGFTLVYNSGDGYWYSHGDHSATN